MRNRNGFVVIGRGAMPDWHEFCPRNHLNGLEHTLIGDPGLLDRANEVLRRSNSTHPLPPLMLVRHPLQDPGRPTGRQRPTDQTRLRMYWQLTDADSAESA